VPLLEAGPRDYSPLMHVPAVRSPRRTRVVELGDAHLGVIDDRTAPQLTVGDSCGVEQTPLERSVTYDDLPGVTGRAMDTLEA
jgi:hypothetical protein